MRDVQDHYFHQAKREGYLSRAAYKLIEIDERKRIMRKGDRVLDCGAAPGSWMQVALKRIGEHGAVVGIDLQPIKHRFNQSAARTIEGDFTRVDPHTLIQAADEASASTGARAKTGRLFDVVLSDMAPKTTGDPFSDHHYSVRLCDALRARCTDLLKPGGNLVMKVFEGEAYPDLLKRTQSMFEAAKGFKPKASRSESTEMYIVATGFLGSRADDAQQRIPAKRKPVTVWPQE